MEMMNDQDAACPAAGSKALEGYVLMPKRLTAENGAKGALSGEFKEGCTVTCHECGGSGDDAESDNDAQCAECKGDGTLEQDVPVTWDTIKSIYAAAVELLAASPQVEVAQLKDHEIREAVNQLRDIAVEFHAHQSLRDRLAAIVLPLARAGAAQVEVAPQAEQPQQLSEIWRKNGDVVIGPKPQGDGWLPFTIPGYAPYQASWPDFSALDAQAIMSKNKVQVERGVLLKLTELARRYFAGLLGATQPKSSESTERAAAPAEQPSAQVKP